MIYHDALVLPHPETGEPWALDITQHSISPRSMPLDAFLAMGDPIIHTRPLPYLHEPTTWDTFGYLKQNRRYHVVHYNCDHFVDELQYYRPRSEQLRRKLAVAAGMLALILLTVLIIHQTN